MVKKNCLSHGNSRNWNIWLVEKTYFMWNWRILSNHSVEISWFGIHSLTFYGKLKNSVKMLWFCIQFLKFHVKSLLCKCKICVFDKFEGSELQYLVIFCTFWRLNCPKLKKDSMYLIFFCTFWTDFTTVWWYLKDLPQWLHLNWLIYCPI